MSDARIIKLLAVARDQEGTPEGETAARIARRLVEASARRRAGGGAAEGFVRREALLGGSAWWRCRLASLVAEHCGCVATLRPRAGKAMLHGRAASVAVAEHLLITLTRALTREQVAFSLGVVGGEQGPERARRVDGFMHSAIFALGLRLQAMRGEAGGAAPGDEALVRRELSAVEAWMTGEGLRALKAPPFPYTWCEQGYRAGTRLELRPALEAGGGEGA